jgi:beta-galactosidase/beta-glucuronidase
MSHVHPLRIYAVEPCNWYPAPSKHTHFILAYLNLSSNPIKKLGNEKTKTSSYEKEKMDKPANFEEDYPRPAFVRRNSKWNSLNGDWDFLFDDHDVGLAERWQLNGLPLEVMVKDANNSESIGQVSKTFKKRKIKVPFVFQSAASGINERAPHEVLWYERTFSDVRSLEDWKKGNRLLLRLGAVDYEATVWVNGVFVGSHRGGHVPFDLDIIDALRAVQIPGLHRVTVRVRDSPYDLTQPRGKQYWAAEPESIYYTPSSGIWQTVFLESVPETRIADSSQGTVFVSNDIASGNLHSTIAVQGRRAGSTYTVEIQGSFQGVLVGKAIAKLPKERNCVSLELNLRLNEDEAEYLPKLFLNEHPLHDTSCWLECLALWSPEHPLLYDIAIRLYDDSENLLDEVNTTTGMRSLEWKSGDGTIRLNGKPYFQALILDQGYWRESNITPPSPKSLKHDIEIAKKMGFNGCRKHQKVEDPIFLYWADRLGYIVWGEMANAYEFSQEYVQRFDQEWQEAVKRDINHPCIVTWTPTNESWGYPALQEKVEQRDHIRSAYYQTR